MAYKVYSTNYLMKLTKAEIIDILRMAEHNYIATEEALTRSADYGKGLLKEIERLKKADVQPVKRGKWINDGDCLICSCCKTAYNSWFTGSNYCAECGADMRGEDNE